MAAMGTLEFRAFAKGNRKNNRCEMRSRLQFPFRAANPFSSPAPSHVSRCRCIACDSANVLWAA